MPPNKKPQPPAKPKFRSLNDLSRSIKIVPYFLAGDPEIIASHIKDHKENELYQRDDVFAVGVGMLKFRHYLNYENIHGETLDQTANKVMYVFYALSKQINPNIDDREMPELIVDEEKRITQTPFGPMYGSIEKNGTLLLTFLLTQFGRIVGVNGSGDFELEEISEDDVIDLLDPNAIFNVDPVDGKSIFMDILEVTGLYDPTKAAAKLTESGEVKEEELKN